MGTTVAFDIGHNSTPSGVVCFLYPFLNLELRSRLLKLKPFGLLHEMGTTVAFDIGHNSTPSGLLTGSSFVNLEFHSRLFKLKPFGLF
jgi:hypothetical protein